MRRVPSLASLVVPLAGVLVLGLATGAYAQDGTPAAGNEHGGHGESAGTPAAESTYAAGYDPAAPIRSLTPEEIAQIERGEGAGFALPAELNGVPGPRHVLDLAADLGLSDEQATRVRAVYDQLQAAAIPAGRRYLDALRALEEDFRAGTLPEADLAARVAEGYRLEGELAAAHLGAHLQTAAILTPDQIAAYSRLRGYE